MKHIAFLLLLLPLFKACKPKNDTLVATISIDIESKTNYLTLFGQGIISTPLYERDLAIHPEGNEMIYTLGDYKQKKRCLVILNKNNETWSAPGIMSISGTYHDIEPFYANNGNRLYFASNRPIYNDSTRTDYNIWFSDKVKGIWTNPKALDSTINTPNDEFFPSVSNQGNLFFTATKPNGIGKEDIFIAKYEAGTFKNPEPLPAEINTPFYEFNAYISPDEDVIVFSSYGRADDLGGGDLYISRKDKNGAWSPSKNMGALINSNKLDYCPFIDWKHGNLYFTSERLDENNEILESVNALKNFANSPLNGFGNIYKISLDKIDELH
ncbi:TolB family protein [Aestuariibaculum suncheonense]|uniref:PD40 domain-containing protein n=1 Tax=Aestuariibaculum suncheonense TaxID=1028745 RepID=A0A8J6Q3S7_9FLAO|nr:PD40 domain-containing protein [Aestuariibaculum suncheonense]MBD0834608.1 PD40 domain-containing protein [Aestuariibaculum suncheonense]